MRTDSAQVRSDTIVRVVNGTVRAVDPARHPPDRRFHIVTGRRKENRGTERCNGKRRDAEDQMSVRPVRSNAR